MDDTRTMLDRCIAQLDEGVILANQAGQNSALYRWTQDAAALLFEIREERRNPKCTMKFLMDENLYRCTLSFGHDGQHDFGTISNAKK